MKDILQQLITTVHPKQWTKFIRHRPEFLDWLDQQYSEINCKNFSEKIYLIVNGSNSSHCENGFKRKFNTFNLGYRPGCTEPTCRCRYEGQAKKLSANWKNRSAADKLSILEKSRNTCLEKYGVDHIQKLDSTIRARREDAIAKYGVDHHMKSEEVLAKIKTDNQKKYGVDFPLQSSEIHKKTQQTTLDRYGSLMTHARIGAYNKYDKNPFQAEEVQQKIRKTLMKKYGAVHPSQSLQLQEKKSATMIDRYGVNNASQIHYTEFQREILLDPIKFSQFIDGKTPVWVGNELGIRSENVVGIARRYGLVDKLVTDGRSAMEADVVDWLAGTDIRYEKNNRNILGDKKELDFYFPEQNVALELNGLYHHSELGMNKDKFYHAAKWANCSQKNIQLITIWQDEYWKSKPIVLSKLGYLLNIHDGIKIGARECTITSLTLSEEKEFYTRNHIQGFAGYRALSLCARHKDNIVACMSWRKKGDAWEIIRYATNIGNLIPGMFSKLLRHSIVNFSIQGRIISFSDNRVSNGNLYLKNGFTHEDSLGPAYCYTDYSTRFNRQLFFKSKLQQRYSLDEEYVKNNTEWTIAQELGFDRLWDCGKKKWVMYI